MEGSNVFEKIYQKYLQKVLRIDVHFVKDRLGLSIDQGDIVIPFFGVPYQISAQGITDHKERRPSHPVCVLLCKYLLMCPETQPVESHWVTYKDFKDAAPFVGGFFNNVEKPISETFSGRLTLLKRACEALNGQPVESRVSCDLAVHFDALPRVPVLLLFNDQDEEFPAKCSLLFERRTEKYLDVEGLAMVGMELAERLKHYT